MTVYAQVRRSELCFVVYASTSARPSLERGERDRRAHHHADRGVGFQPMTTGADGGAAITALLGHPDHRTLTDVLTPRVGHRRTALRQAVSGSACDVAGSPADGAPRPVRSEVLR